MENNKLVAKNLLVLDVVSSYSPLSLLVASPFLVAFVILSPFLIVFVIMSPYRRRLRLRCYDVTVACPLCSLSCPCVVLVFGVAMLPSLVVFLSSSSQRLRDRCRYVAVACRRRSVVVAWSSSLVVLFIARSSLPSSLVAASWLTSSLVVVVSRPSSLAVFVAL